MSVTSVLGSIAGGVIGKVMGPVGGAVGTIIGNKAGKAADDPKVRAKVKKALESGKKITKEIIINPATVAVAAATVTSPPLGAATSVVATEILLARKILQIVNKLKNK